MLSEELLRTEGSWVERSPHRSGGNACIRHTRITVYGLVEWKTLGLSDAEILEAVGGLTSADLEAAWLFSERNPGEIERAIRANNEA